MWSVDIFLPIDQLIYTQQQCSVLDNFNMNVAGEDAVLGLPETGLAIIPGYDLYTFSTLLHLWCLSSYSSRRFL